MTNTHTHNLALLIAVPHFGESAMYRDQAAMAQTLLGRGLSADEIISLHGQLDRQVVIAFLQAASRRVSRWMDGAVFLHVSGHGFYDGDMVETARPGLLFSNLEAVQNDDYLFWDEVFTALVLPANVKLTLLPDL
jgi:hypothetical protein